LDDVVLSRGYERERDRSMGHSWDNCSQ